MAPVVRPTRPSPRPAPPRPRVRPRPINRPGLRPIRGPARPPASLPKSIPFSRKPWIRIGTRLLGRLGLGTLGFVLDPTMLGDGTVQIIGRPQPRPGGSPARNPLTITFAPEDVPNRHTPYPDVTYEAATVTGPKKVLRSARLPDPAVKRSLERGRVLYVPRHVLLEVLPTDLEPALDAALDRPGKVDLPDFNSDMEGNLWRKGEKINRKVRRKREKRREERRKKREPKPNPHVKPRPEPRPDPHPNPRPKPDAKPKPQPGPDPRPPSKPEKPAPKPDVKPGKPAVPPSVPAPEAPPKPGKPPVKPPVIQPDPPEQPRYQPGPMYAPEVVFDARTDRDGNPQVRIRTRRVRQPRDGRPRKEKDQKYGGRRRGAVLYKFITDVWGGYTEAMDLWDALKGNLYVGTYGKSAIYLEASGMSDLDMLKLFMQGRADVDVDGFFVDYMVNQSEDRTIGRLSGALTRSIIENGFDPGAATATQRLNWLRRTRAQGDF